MTASGPRSLAARLQARGTAALRLGLELPPDACLALRPPPSGRAGRTLLVQQGDRTLAVLRAFYSRRRLRRLSEASARLAALGVPVARVVWSDASLLGRLWRGAFLALEEHLPGVTLGRVAERDLALDRLAAVLARLHAQRRAEWGTFRSGKRGGFAAYRLAQIRGLIRSLRRHRGLARPEARRLQERFAGWGGRLRGLAEFRLIHNDLHAENILVGPDGTVSLIDLYRVRFDLRERELAGVLGRLLDLQPERSRRFLDRYVEAGGEAPSPDLQELETAVLCLSRWSSLSLRAAREPQGAGREAIQALAQRWRERALQRSERL